MTSEELDRLEKLCEGATKGPWTQDCQPSGACASKCYNEAVFSESVYPNIRIADRPRWDCGKSHQTFRDMVFIAASRDAMPKLIAEVRRLQKELAAQGEQTNAK